MDIKYEYQFDMNDIDEIVRIYHGNHWNGHNQEEVITLFNTATHVVIAKKRGPSDWFRQSDVRWCV